MRYHCHCLNVSIDVLQTIDEQETLAQIVPVDLAQFVNKPHEWVICDIPSDRSIHITWPTLLQVFPVREMKLNRCSACQMHTHVTNVALNRILINKDLLDEDAVHSVYLDPNYSKIAKIVLPSTMESLNMTRSSSSLDESVRRECESVQQLYRKNLDEAEQETEQRIRVFQREQDELLANQTKELKIELNAMLNLIRSASRQTLNTKGSPILQSSYINENSTESGFGSDIFDIGAIDVGRNISTVERGFSERTVNSDEETNDDPMLDNRGWNMDAGSLPNFATSVPRNITLPASITRGLSRQNDFVSADLERIGQSFRDLSRSMCTDGTEVFGELPSPRQNTHHT